MRYGMKAIRKIIRVLAAASGAIMASPVKLPPGVVMVAKCVAVALGVLEAVEGTAEQEGPDAVEPE